MQLIFYEYIKTVSSRMFHKFSKGALLCKFMVYKLRKYRRKNNVLKNRSKMFKLSKTKSANNLNNLSKKFIGSRKIKTIKYKHKKRSFFKLNFMKKDYKVKVNFSLQKNSNIGVSKTFILKKNKQNIDYRSMHRFIPPFIKNSAKINFVQKPVLIAQKKFCSSFIVTDENTSTNTLHPTVVEQVCDIPQCRTINCATTNKNCDTFSQKHAAVAHLTHSKKGVVEEDRTIHPLNKENKGEIYAVVYPKPIPLSTEPYQGYMYHPTKIVQDPVNTKILQKATLKNKTENYENNTNDDQNI